MSETFTPDTLFAGSEPVPVTGKGTILSGQGALVRGTVLGKIMYAIAAAVAGTNSGGGTCTGQALGKGVKIGTYTITCITTATNGGTFKVIDPEGYRLADAVVGTAYDGPIKFTLTDVGTDFAAGDSFTIAVSAGSGKMKLADKDNVDGSQYVEAILAQAVDATSADKVAATYEQGCFNEGALTFASGETADDRRAEMKLKGFFLRSVLAG